MDLIARKWMFLAVTALFFCSSVAGFAFMSSEPAGNAQDLGTVDNTVELEFSSDYHVYKEVYVADAENDMEGTNIEEWRPVEVDANTYPPRSVWSADFGSDSILFSDSAELDVSGYSGGGYYVFPWGCTTHSTMGGMSSPGECDWLEPFYFEKEGSADAGSGTGPEGGSSSDPDSDSDSESECEQQGYTCVHPGTIQGVDADSKDYECSETALACYDFPDEEDEDVDIDVLLSGHMGAGKNGNGLAPENTIMAFQKAREVGIDSVEFDVRRAEDGYVVFHDADTERTVEDNYDGIPIIGDHAGSMDVADTSVDELTELSPTKDYEVVDSDYATSMDRAERATIPSLEEALDYLERTDLVMRIELKGEIQGDHEMGREIYNMVEERGMVDRAIFMSFEGDCNSLSLSRTCTYPALEAIEDESGGQARTAVLWQAQRDLTENGIGNVRQLDPEDAMEEAAEQNFDIFVPRVDEKYFGRQVGLKAFHMDPDDFVEKAEEHGFDYAFMSFNQAESGRENMELLLTEYDVEWISWNKIDSLMNNAQEIEQEGLEYDLEESDDEGGGDGEGATDPNEGVIPVAP